MNRQLTAGVIATIMLATTGITSVLLQLQSAEATSDRVEFSRGIRGQNFLNTQAPPAITGDNVYVAWWTNDTANNNNNEVMFRASTDGGQTFSDQINLSNTTDSDSTRVEIDSDADSVVVSWWETNQTDDTPVMRVSNDNGITFGPLLKLAANDTIDGGP